MSHPLGSSPLADARRRLAERLARGDLAKYGAGLDDPAPVAEPAPTLPLEDLEPPEEDPAPRWARRARSRPGDAVWRVRRRGADLEGLAAARLGPKRGHVATFILCALSRGVSLDDAGHVGIAAAVGNVSRRTVYAAVDDLEARGMIRKQHRRYRDGRGCWRSLPDVYRFEGRQAERDVIASAWAARSRCSDSQPSTPRSVYVGAGAALSGSPRLTDDLKALEDPPP